MFFPLQSLVLNQSKSAIFLNMKSLNGSSDATPTKGPGIEEDVEAKDVSWVDNGEDNRALLSYEEEKKLLRRVDWRLVPLSAFIFLVKSLDVNNVSGLLV